MSENAYEYGTILYRYNEDKKEIWTYFEKVYGEHVLSDPNGLTTNKVHLTEFFKSEIECEIDHAKRKLKKLNSEKHIVTYRLLEYREQVSKGEKLLKTVEDKLELAESYYKYLRRTYPEEFI